MRRGGTYTSTARVRPRLRSSDGSQHSQKGAAIAAASHREICRTVVARKIDAFDVAWNVAKPAFLRDASKGAAATSAFDESSHLTHSQRTAAISLKLAFALAHRFASAVRPSQTDCGRPSRAPQTSAATASCRSRNGESDASCAKSSRPPGRPKAIVAPAGLSCHLAADAVVVHIGRLSGVAPMQNAARQSGVAGRQEGGLRHG